VRFLRFERPKTRAQWAHFALMVVWIVPGIPVSIYLRHSIAWLVFISVYANIAGHASGWSAER
jgi:hypothetical protein